jgi:hypothetical protein
MATLTPAAPPYFAADLARINQTLLDAGAVLRPEDDGFVGLNPTILPALQVTYRNLVTCGWANGWLIP